MTFLTSAAAHPCNTAHATNVFNQGLPVLTTRPALAPSGQVVHVLTTPVPCWPLLRWLLNLQTLYLF
jgi:hypothetical protein